MSCPKTPIFVTIVTKLGDSSGGSMERKVFGKLVQALRKEHRDDDGNLWTQQTLANKAKLSKRAIQRIEDGSLRKLDSQILLGLADALELTIAERKEFFFAAMGVDHRGIASTKYNHLETIEILFNAMRSVSLPAAITDVYADLIAANTALTKLLGIHDNLVNQVPNTPAAYNALRVIFSTEADFRGIVGEQWARSAQRNIQFFRGTSLRYRLNPYFQQLLSTLRKSSSFRRYWEQAHLEENDISAEGIIYEYNHPEFGPLTYLSNTSISITKMGELYPVIYIPMNPRTSNTFTSIVQKYGNDVINLAPWPKEDSQ